MEHWGQPYHDIAEKIIGNLPALTYSSKSSWITGKLKLSKLNLSDELMFQCSFLHSHLNSACSAYGEFPAHSTEEKLKLCLR